MTCIDVVDADSLEDLGLDKVADPDLCHNRDGHGVHDLLDHAGVALRRQYLAVHTPQGYEVWRLTIRATPPSRRMLAGIRSIFVSILTHAHTPLGWLTKRHHSTSTGLLGDLGLLDVHNVHDDTATGQLRYRAKLENTHPPLSIWARPVLTPKVPDPPPVELLPVARSMLGVAVPPLAVVGSGTLAEGTTVGSDADMLEGLY